MFKFVYDLPTWLFCSIIIGTWVTSGVVGLLITRPIVARVVAKRGPANDLVSYFLSACGVFYGITLGLIAVGAWQQFNDVGSRVSNEASSLAALYRNVSAYPQPAREGLTADLKEYTRYVIQEAWPLHRRGEIPKGVTERVDTFQARLYAFEPTTPGQEILHAEAVAEFNNLLRLRQQRLESVTSSLTSTLWVVVRVGAIITIVISWLFKVENLRLHVALVSLMAATMGLLIFLTAAMDNPFRGEVSIGPDAFRLVYDQLME